MKKKLKEISEVKKLIKKNMGEKKTLSIKFKELKSL